MGSPNADQDGEITYISGVTAGGTVAAQAFDTWNDDTPATYSATSYEAKWGTSTAGTGATVRYAFDAASGWSATEKQAFTTAMHLWSAVANIGFTEVASTSAQLAISRADDGTATGGITRYYPGSEGSTTLGVAVKASIAIDTSVYGFGPLGEGLSYAGGYPWTTMEHEIGHAIGLEHAGPYNADATADGTETYPSYGAYDNEAWSLMSYHDANGGGAYPTTPLMFDIAAAQRIYGLPTNSPLSSGGQVFGFHANISGDIAGFYDFTINTRPVVTIWDGGRGNTLDLSGFGYGSTVSLVSGSLNDVGGLSGNLGIAYGTHIETVIGGSGPDKLTGNDDSDVIMGGIGNDTLQGGAGNDHIYGNTSTAPQGSTDGNDQISTNGGNDYVNGNGGDDVITATAGDNRLYGGGANDVIATSNGNNHINGNAGDDSITVNSGSNVILGGQGNDSIRIITGSDVASGDAGDDHIFVGFAAGYTLLTGGGGADTFSFGNAPLDRSGELRGYVDEITDFQIGSDRINLSGADAMTVHDPAVLHDPNATVYSSLASGRAEAQALFDGHAGYSEIAAIQVGADTYLFYNSSMSSDAIDQAIRLDRVAANDFAASSISH
jgi:serralysin